MGLAGETLARSGARRRSAWRLTPRSSAGPIVRMWSDSGATKRQGAWSYPHEAADLMLGVYTALTADWDAMVRRGIFLFPVTWGEGPVGTVGGEDIFQIAEVVNGSPHIYGLWPHAASLFLRGNQTNAENDRRAVDPPARGTAKTKYRSASRWDHATRPAASRHPLHPGSRRLDRRRDGIVRPPRFRDRKPVRGPARHLDQRRADRHVETVIGLRHRARRADRFPLGRSLEARGRRPGPAPVPSGTGHGERSSGGTKEGCGPSSSTTRARRTGEAKLETLPGRDGVSLLIDGKTAAFHWELVAE